MRMATYNLAASCLLYSQTTMNLMRNETIPIVAYDSETPESTADLRRPCLTPRPKTKLRFRDTRLVVSENALHTALPPDLPQIPNPFQAEPSAARGTSKPLPSPRNNAAPLGCNLLEGARREIEIVPLAVDTPVGNHDIHRHRFFGVPSCGEEGGDPDQSSTQRVPAWDSTTRDTWGCGIENVVRDGTDGVGVTALPATCAQAGGKVCQVALVNAWGW